MCHFLKISFESFDGLSFVKPNILLTFCTAKKFEVLDKQLQFDEAIRACSLHKSLTKQRLHYFVAQELKRRQKVFEVNAKQCCPRCKAGMVVDVVTTTAQQHPAGAAPTTTIGRLVAEDNEDDNVTNNSPLTMSSGTRTTTISSSSNEEDSTIAAGSRPQSSKNIKRRTRRSSQQASEARIDEKEAQKSLQTRYSVAFKEATVLLSPENTHLNKANKVTASDIIHRLNEDHFLYGTKKQLAKSTIYRAIAKGNMGMGPKKKGPPPKIPDTLLKVLATHTEVCQVGVGELRGRDIKRLIGAATLGTDFDNKFKVESVWRKVRREFPEKLQAASKICIDDARAQWTTYTNLQQWFNDAKRDLIDSGLVIDQEVRDGNGNLISELDFRSEEVRRRIINMDETHHDLSITGDRGGPRCVMYHNPNLQRGSKRGVKSSRHVTGVYATNAGGESLPPMYIFDSCAKIDDNFRVKVQWLDGLPTVTGRYGCPTRVESSSFYSVRSRGSMVDSLLNEYIDKVVLPLYPNISKHATFDVATGTLALCSKIILIMTNNTHCSSYSLSGKLLCGPVVFKIDSGPGRIVASMESILKRHEYFEKGLIILSGLPNSTSVQQEMDALYGPFKSATYDRAEQLVMEMLKERGAMRRGAGGVPPPGGGGASILSLGFQHLATIVDGKEGDETLMKPFTKHFTQEKILKAWAKIGFVPFSRKCLLDKKVWHELGQADVNADLENLHENYLHLVATAEEQGLNPGVFDASIPLVNNLDRAVDEDHQVQQLLAQKGAFSASALWNVCGTRVGNARVVIRAQREQMAIDEAKVTLQTQGRIERQVKCLANAQAALAKHNTLGIGALTDKDWGDIIRWVLPEAKVTGLMRELKKKDAIIAKLATLDRDWKTYIPARTPL